MIIYDTQHWVPTDINMLTIAGTDDDYYYIHRALYDEAVVLDYLYHDDIPKLIYAITGQYESREDVDYFMENTPRPLSIFGPFLLLVKDLVEDYSDMVGAIHVMSGPVNLCKMVEIDPAMRNTPKYSLSIKEEYELAWNRFFQTVIPYSPDMYTSGGSPMNGTMTSTVDDGEYDPANMTDDEVDDALWALLNPPADALDLPEDTTTEEESVAAAPEVAAPSAPPAPAPAPTPVKEPEPVSAQTEEVQQDSGVPKRLTGLAALTGGLV